MHDIIQVRGNFNFEPMHFLTTCLGTELKLHVRKSKIYHSGYNPTGNGSGFNSQPDQMS